MALKLKTADTYLVLTALREYRMALADLPPEVREAWIESNIEDLDRLIKSYERSFKALCRWDVI